MMISVLGRKDFSKNFGKKGTCSDISLYNLKTENEELTFVEPSSYPEKIVSLLDAVEMSDAVILYVSQEIMNFQLGEIILALDYLQKKQGILVLDGFVKEQLDPLFAGKVVSSYPIVENNVQSIKSAISGFKFSRQGEGNTAVLDHSFQVKGVGDVFLGIVLSGVVKQYDKLNLLPAKKEAMIKSLQVHDVDVKEVPVGKRIGGAVKGCGIDDLKRGSILTDSTKYKVSNEVSVDFQKNKLLAGEVTKRCMCFIGSQFVSCEFGDDRIKFEKDVVYFEGQSFLLCDSSKKIRIMGSGVVK